LMHICIPSPCKRTAVVPTWPASVLGSYCTRYEQ
jgi:hypothetical protein